LSLANLHDKLARHGAKKNSNNFAELSSTRFKDFWLLVPVPSQRRPLMRFRLARPAVHW